jgi:hypothetical protein
MTISQRLDEVSPGLTAGGGLKQTKDPEEQSQ